MEKEKERLDRLLTGRGLASSREKAKALITAGNVYVNGKKETRAGAFTDPQAEIEIRGEVLPYVSRGGLKLEKAIRQFSIPLQGKICMDVGASTGGFTDCMLQNGAKRVYAVDVGHDQLAEKLRQDARVVMMEGTNIRYVTPEMIAEPIQFASADVSFISLKLVLPVVRSILAQKAFAVCLIKPQFEAGRANVGKKGVVRDQKVHIQVVSEMIAFAQSAGFHVCGLTGSPVKGPEGNIEYLIFLEKTEDGEEGSCLRQIVPKQLVAEAYESF